MAFSGSGGAYYRSNATIGTGANLDAAYTRHMWIRASATPSTANTKTAGGHRCTTGSPSGSPHNYFNWNSTSSTFMGAHQHRRNSGAYDAAKATTANLTADTWHSLCVTYNGTTLQGYLNGIADGSASSANSTNYPAFFDLLAQITPAGALDGSSQLDIGQVAEFATWNAVLSADEIVALAKGFRPRLIRPQSLVFYAPLVRERIDERDGRTLNLIGGSEVISDHPRVFG